MTSIRRRLIVLLLVAVGGTWGVAAALVYKESASEVRELLDANLVQGARLIIAVLGHSGFESIEEQHELEYRMSGLVHRFEINLEYVVRAPDGHVLARSAGAPALPEVGGLGGFTNLSERGHPWRVFTASHPSMGYTVQTAERRDRRNDAVHEMARYALLPLVVLLPVLVLAIGWLVPRGLAPIGRLTQELRRRDPEQLDPIGSGKAPAELRPLVGALDDLFERLRRALDRERRFTGDAAHELRTPLAAMRAHAQVAQRARDAAEREASIDGVLTAVDRATRLVDQLLSLARVDAGRAALVDGTTDLREVVDAVVAQQSSVGASRDVTVGLDAGAGPWPVRGDRAGLELLVRNLVDNAVRYSPAGGGVHVSLGRDDGAVVLGVSDAGPGIPAAERTRVFERFYRGRGAPASGSGLGLAIVAEVVERLGARVTLDDGSEGRGLKVTVRFPRANPA